MSVEPKATFTEWAVLELMGHRKLAGLVSEAVIAGQGFLRLDIPAETRYKPDGSSIEYGASTQFYSPSSVYSLTPVTEATARAFAEGHRPEPVTRWELPRLEPALRTDDDEAPEDLPF